MWPLGGGGATGAGPWPCPEGPPEGLAAGG